MFYSIYGLCPSIPYQMGGFGFSIRLWPSFREAVALSGLDQRNIDQLIANMGRSWLDACGYDQIYDPEAPFDLFEETDEKYERKLEQARSRRELGWEERLKLCSPTARPLYTPKEAIRVSWGEWGPEHIQVPGDACGLDIGRWGGGNMGAPEGGQNLHPHNIDNWSQVQLLLLVFCWIADHIAHHHMWLGVAERMYPPEYSI